MPDTIQLQHWLPLVPDTRPAQRLMMKDMKELAGRIGGEADKLLAEFENASVAHKILKDVRAVIETRATHLLRIMEKA
jgi:serine/threonine-protein kinase HipA